MRTCILLCACIFFATVSRAADQREMVASQLTSSRDKYTTAAAWLERRSELRKAFLEGAGLWPVPARTPLNPIIHSRREYDGYSVENVALEAMPGFYCTGNLYRPLKPEKISGPGILCPHGHFKPLGRMRDDHQIRCAHFARMGATVFSYSMVGWQDSQQTTHDDPLVLALQTWNSIRALDFISGLAEVDAKRIGITGASGGATQTFFLASLDDRVTASAPVVIVYPWAAPAGCKCEGGLPVMQAALTNAIELAGSVAPRPQLLISCGGDETKDFPQVGFPFIQHVYQVHDQKSAVENVHLADEAHDYGPSKRKAVYQFFAKHLGLAAADEDLSRIKIEPPEKMAVFDDRHPLPPQALHGSAEVDKAFRALDRPAAATTGARISTAPAAAAEGESYFFTPRGFEREGKVAFAKEDHRGVVKITVIDAATRKPTPCRINVVGSDGNFYQPASDRLSTYALTGQWPNTGVWGNRKDKAPYRYLGRFFYSTGEVEVPVIPGRVRVEVAKGFEYTPQSLSLDVREGETRLVDFALEHAADATRFGYYSGDLHLHIPRGSERDEQTIFDLMAAEDIRYGSILGYNEPAGPYAGFMDKMASPQQRGLGKASILEKGGYQIASGQEYRSSTYGHLLVFLRDKLVFPEQSFNADLWPVYGHVGKETHAAGGFTIHAHGGYAQEIYADAALGTVDAVELLQFGVYRGIGLADWYHMLNTGYRFPCVGASDWPACRFLGDCKTFVRAAGSNPPSFPDWLKGAVDGHSFVSTGPMLFVDVNGKKPGERIEFTGDGPHEVNVTIRAQCVVTPDTRLQLIINGEVVERFDVPPGGQPGKLLSVEHHRGIAESSWIAVRAYSTTPGGQPDAEAHSNPVYVYVNGRAPYRQASLDEWVERIDTQIANHRRRDFPEKARVLDYFQSSRDLLLKIRQRSGLLADEDPAKLAVELGSSRANSPVAVNASIPNPTDDELKEFLRPVPSMKPSEAIKAFDVADGFDVQVVAAEPLVCSPVAATFDENMALYVCEMRDYPYKPSNGREPIGSVRLLRDTNRDGVFDKSTIFADKLLWAAGVVPWNGGVFVAASPDIWYLKDTDGDDRADLRKQVFTGFGTENQQAMVNNLVFGLDHKIYGTTAGNGGVVRRGTGFDSTFKREVLEKVGKTANGTGEKSGEEKAKWSVTVTGRDFRFDPFTGEFETISGTVQFGNTFDDWGNRFVCSESQPLQHIVLPQHYLARNPYLPVPSAINNIAPGPVPIFRISPVERWRQIRSSRRIAKGERSANSAGASHHVVDAAAGVTVYRGGAFPSKYYGTLFVGDGQNNLVHHRRLIPESVTFRSERVEPREEFLRSSDIWFRPVNFLNAPDGTLYCVDMNREVLESIHIPLDVVKHLDLTSGRDHGRIYRIAPKGYAAPPAAPFGSATDDQLVEALTSNHGWWRDTAMRLIHQRQDSSMAASLERVVAENPNAVVRVAALWSLQGLNALRDELLVRCLADSHPRVRECSVQLAEPLLRATKSSAADGKPSQLVSQVIGLAADSDPRVRLQVAFTLGEITDPRAATALAQMARKESQDIWTRTAVLSSVAHCAKQVFTELASDESTVSDSNCLSVLEQLAEIVGAGNRDKEVRDFLELLVAIPSLKNNRLLQTRMTLALGRGMKRAGARLPNIEGESGSARLLARLLEDARRTAEDSSASESLRIHEILLLGKFSFASTSGSLQKVLQPEQPQAVQIAAVRTVADYSDSQAAELLLPLWNQSVPEVRLEILRALLAREEWTIALLTAARNGQATVAEVDAVQRERLCKHVNSKLRELALELFHSAANRSRAAVIADYKPALALQADVNQGAQVFEKHCAGCHQLNGKGFAIGPNLASSPARDPEVLLTHILDPNQYVLPNYMQYTVVDKQGRIYTGMLASQTATSITLKRDRDATDTILRLNMDEMLSSGKSLMPEGVEQNVSKSDMAHLISFLQQSVDKSGGASDGNRERDFGTLPGLIEPTP